MTTGDVFDRTWAPDDRPAPRARFPLGLCVAAVLWTSLGLVAAATGVRWGAAPPAGDHAFDAAWVYVHMLLMLAWLVLWPAAALGRYRRLPALGSVPPYRVQLLWDGGALGVAAIPAAGVAAFLSDVSPMMVFTMLALQAAAALLAAGALACAAGRGTWEGAAAGLLVGAAAAGPVVVYLCAEFLPAADGAWYVAVPLMAVAHAARPGEPAAAAFWWVVGAYAGVGMALGWVGRRE